MEKCPHVPQTSPCWCLVVEKLYCGISTLITEIRSDSIFTCSLRESDCWALWCLKGALSEAPHHEGSGVSLQILANPLSTPKSSFSILDTTQLTSPPPNKLTIAKGVSHVLCKKCACQTLLIGTDSTGCVYILVFNFVTGSLFYPRIVQCHSFTLRLYNN